MHEKIESPKALATFRRAPDDDQAVVRQDLLHEVVRGIRDSDIRERLKQEAVALGLGL